MAKIGDLVKTYRLLSDPNAPDWNIKFIGGIVVALAVIAGAAAVVWSMNSDDPETLPAATGEPSAPAEPADACAPISPSVAVPTAASSPCAETVLP